MDQVVFSNIVRDYISEQYPAFLDNISFQEDSSFDCSLKSGNGEFSVWIATYNSEITLGLEAQDGDSSCHTHMSFYGEDFDEQLEAMKNYLEDIFSNKLLFMKSSLSGYTWTDNIDDTLKKQKNTELIEFFKWTSD